MLDEHTMKKSTAAIKLLALALALAMAVSLFSGIGVASSAEDGLVFPNIYPASAIKPYDWDDPQLSKLAWGVVNSLTTAELYDMMGGSNTNRGRNNGVWEESYTWGTGYVNMAGALGVPVLRIWDGPQGVVTVGHFDTTLPPSEPAAAATWDRDAMYKYGVSCGRDNKLASGNVQLGSQIDVIRSTHFIHSRNAFSEDTYLGSEMAVQFAKGMEDNNVMTTLRHVAGYNFSTGTSRDVRGDEQTFHENWMKSPRKAIAIGGASAVMSPYNRINLPFFDTWHGDPGAAENSQAKYPLGPQAALCDYMLVDCLRDMYGYQGITMTDWGGNTGFSGFLGTTLETGTISRNTQAAFESAIAAGQGTLDDVKQNAYYNLMALGKIGYLGLVQLDADGNAIRGTIDGGYNTIELRHPLGQERYDALWENEALNLEVETKGAVLLKNNNNALPLKDAAGNKVAVVGLSGQYALTSHYMETSAGWVQAKSNPIDEIKALMPLSDVQGYIGVNDIVGVPIPADLLWSEIAQPTQPEYPGDYEGVAHGVSLTVGDASTSSAALANAATKILPDFKVLTGTNDYKNGPNGDDPNGDGNGNGPNGDGNGNGIAKGQAGRAVSYFKAPATGPYGFKILAIGGTAYGNNRISLLGDDMEIESSTALTFTATTFGLGTGIPAGSGYGTSSDVATREGLNIIATFNNVNLQEGRWYMIEAGAWTALNAKDAQFQINWLPGNTTDASRSAAVAAAGVPGTDVLFFAHQRGNGGSAASATTNDLAAVQVSFLNDVAAAAHAAGNKVIFVGNIALAVNMPWIDQVDAILWMWLGGDMVGRATAQLLAGAVSPSGKTQITFPINSQQSQFGNSYVQNGNVASPGTYSVYFEGIYGGYKWYDWQNPEGVLFPFGYGLSYTTFAYSNLKVDKTPGVSYGYTVSVDVENTGDVYGGDAVQVYLSAPADYTMPAYDGRWIMEDVQIAKKALVQFDKVYLNPGEKKTVTMPVDREDLMYWDANAPLATQPDGTRGKWRPVLGERTFMVGGSSANLPLQATVLVERSDDEPGLEDNLMLSADSWNILAVGGNTTISVTSNASWSASSSDTSWLTVTPTSGSNNGSLTLTAQPNAGANRAGTITVAGGGIARTVEVTQMMGDEPDALAFTVERKQASPGERIEAPIRISNNPGVAQIRIEVSLHEDLAWDYDPAAYGSNPSTWPFVPSYDVLPMSGRPAGANLNESYASLYFAGDGGNSIGDGTLVVLKLKVKDGASGGEKPIAVAVATCKNESYADVPHSPVVPGIISVDSPEEPQPKYAALVINGTGSGDFEEGATVHISAGTPPEGQQFKEWTTASPGVAFADPQSAITSFAMPGNAVTVTAVFAPIPDPAARYAVTYDLNGGTGAYVTFVAAPLTGITPPSGSLQFKEWNTEQSGSGTPYAPGDIVTMPASGLTLYAIWENDPNNDDDPDGDDHDGDDLDDDDPDGDDLDDDDEITMAVTPTGHYSPYGGDSFSFSATPAPSSLSVDVSSNAAWLTFESDGANCWIARTAANYSYCNRSGKLTLQAKYGSTVYATKTIAVTQAGKPGVSIAWNDGTSVKMNSSPRIPGEPIGTLPTPTRTGYAFVGWFTSPSSGIQITPSTPVPASNTTYYAHWVANTVTITWNACGGTWSAYGSASSQATLTTVKTVGLPMGALPTTTREGYTFTGWYTSPSGGPQITPSTPVPASNTMYYAHWVANTVTITWTVYTASSSETLRTSKIVGLPMGTLPTPPTRAGYAFVGWFTSLSGGTQITPSTPVPTSNTTYYAHWTTAISVSIGWNANGGMVYPTITYHPAGQRIGALPTPTRAGYAFVGWFTTASGGTQITPNTIVQLTMLTVIPNYRYYAH